MTEAERLFRQTEIERKRIARGDKNKKRGGGRYVRLPSDNLSKKEREALNGEIFTFDPRKFYTIGEFNKLPEEYKVRWLNSVMSRYDVGIQTISTVVLGKSKGYLYEQARRQEYLQYLNKRDKGFAPRQCDINKLKSDVEAARNGPSDNSPNPRLLIPAHEPSGIAENIDHAILTIDDKSHEAPKQDISTITALIAALAGTGAKLHIEVTL